MSALSTSRDELVGPYGELVRIDELALARYAGQLSAAGWHVPDWRLPVYPVGDDEFAQFAGVLNAVNFCLSDPVSTAKYAVEYAGQRWAGATGLAAALTRARGDGLDVTDVAQLARLDLVTARHVFRSDGAPLPMLAERVALLNSLAASLHRYGGRFSGLFAQCGFDTATIITALVAQFPAYAGDRVRHPVSKQQISFDKRARLLALMYQGRAQNSAGRLPLLGGLGGLGPVVDYQLPRALRSAGVLHYGARLATQVDNRWLIAPGSVEEIAIRSATHDAVERLLDLLHARGAEVTMLELDDVLWRSGRSGPGMHHLTYTTAY